MTATTQTAAIERRSLEIKVIDAVTVRERKAGICLVVENVSDAGETASDCAYIRQTRDGVPTS